MQKSTLLMLAVIAGINATAQDSLPKFQFEDVDATPTKTYCTPKVLNQSANKFISIGYEMQGAFPISYSIATPTSIAEHKHQVNNVRGLRLGFSTPVISTNKLVANVSANYWRSGFGVSSHQHHNTPIQSVLTNGMHTAGIGTTIFKPLNDKNFLLVQANADANWSANSLSNITTKALTVNGSVLYGWKKSDNNMIAIGASRTYRLGRPLIVPVVLWNKTFNDKWGMELLLPARAHIRYNVNPKSMLFAGFELEGNQYALYQNNSNSILYLQRGEIKPRLMYERSIAGFWWISIQAGARINGRFNVVNQYNGDEAREVLTTTLGTTWYSSISLQLISL
jgi:hypothetical protein